MLNRYAISVLIITIIVAAFSCKNPLSNNFQEPKGKEAGSLTLNSRACYFADADSIEKQIKIKIDTPSCREIEQVKSIMEYAGLPQNFKIYRGNIDNALATVVNNQRLIIYNKDLFATMDDLNSSYWSSLFIIAHEIGHHLADNISDTSNALSAELDADKFAGFILYRMGADSNQVIDAVASNLISTVQDSKTHPAKEKRIAAVKESWNTSYNLRFMSAVPPAIHDRFTDALGKDYEKYRAGFSQEYLIFNSFFLSKWNLTRINYYDVDYYALDTTYLQYLKSKTIHLKGIITDVQQRRAVFPEVKLLAVEILVTQADSINFPGIAQNQKSTFWVAYQPLFSYDKEKDFFDFFVGGRRIDFDVYEWIDNEKKSYYMSSAYCSKQTAI